jgi:surface protein
MYTVIGAFILVMLLTTVTYAFFNYTRTGVANNIRTGRIYFNTSQDGTLNLTNMFPVASNEVGNDYTEDTVKITVTGDTTYTSGMEYLVTAEEVNVETSTGKKVPLTLNVAVTDDLGTEDTDSDQVEYFTDRGSTTSYYKILSESVLYDGQYLLVGYIAPGQSGVDGTINIKAYIDKDKVAISDTYPSGDVTHTESSGEASIEVFDYTNGTTSNWVNGRVVLTTSEWNSLQTMPLSFKVKVEANEGTWVDPAILVNAAERIPSALTQNITEIYFVKETPIRMERRYNAATVKADITNTTLNEGKVLAWQEGNKLYIASSGETYLPQNSSGYFSGLSNVTKIEFENVNTSRVTQMNSMFQGCSSLTGIDLSNFDMSNLTQMHAMFSNCTSLRKMDLHNLGNDGLTGISSLFTGCTNLEEINMSGFSFGSGSMIQMFSGLTSLKTVNLANANTQNVTNMKELFKNSSNLINVNLTGNGGNNLSNITDMFTGCTNLVEINMSGFNFGSSLMEYLFLNLTSL